MEEVDPLTQAAELGRSGRLAEALTAYERALAASPDNAEALNNYSATLGILGRDQEAIANLDRALKIKPDFVEALNNRGTALNRLGRHRDAVESYEAALRLKADYPDALEGCGSAYLALGKTEEALAKYKQALSTSPRHLDAIIGCAKAFSRANRMNEALETLDRALAIDPNHVEALGQQGIVFAQMQRLDAALASFDRALEVKPGDAGVMNNRATVLMTMMRWPEALASLDGALARDPDSAEALNNRSIVLSKIGRADDALKNVQLTLSIRPDFAAAHLLEALLRLQQGDFAEGLKKYQWRWLDKTQGMPERKFSQPLWLGSPDIRGKTLLVHHEQGLGDCLQFVRYLPLVGALGARLIVEVPGPVSGLVAHMQGVMQVLAYGERLPDTDFHCPLLSLPLALGTTMETIPAPIPYLRPDASSAAEWRAKLARHGEKLVGISWRGSPGYKGDHERSIDFRDVAALLDVPGIRFVSLQKEIRDEERSLADGLIHPGAGFLDTANLIGALDLVISVDTAWAHWAGAVGRPLWVLLSPSPHWVWFTNRHDSPWYPTARLFRQRTFGDWTEVLRNVREELTKWRHSDSSIASADEGEAKTRLQEAEALNQKGCGYLDQHRYQAALEAFDRALEQSPDYAFAVCNRGNALKGLRRNEEALAAYEKSIRLLPTLTEAWNNRGNLLWSMKRTDAAFHSVERALQLAPEFAEVLSNRGNMLRWQGRYEEAHKDFDRALAIKPDLADAWNNRGGLHQDLAQDDQALQNYRRALELNPEFAEARLSEAICLLRSGRLPEGWEKYEWRWHASMPGLRKPFAQPKWSGENLSGRSVLLHAEQGYGDTIQFVRYASMLASQGARVWAQVPAVLGSIVGTVDGVSKVLCEDETPPLTDFHCPLLSLPLLFKTDAKSIPAKVPYLSVPAEKAALWARNKLFDGQKPRVGIVWAGRKTHQNDRHRSIALRSLDRLFMRKNAEFISLQKDVDSFHAAALADYGVLNLSAELRDFGDTAAIVSKLDLLISVDTSSAHLAGALAIPTWVLLSYSPDWRWMLDRQDSPWYPTIRLFRQPSLGDWESVVRNVDAALQGFLSQRKAN